MTFTEEWFGEASQRALADLFALVRHLTGEVVEVGCWEGRSTLALAAAARPAIVHAVDTWEGSPGEVSESLASERDIFATFCANTTGANIVPHRTDWRSFFSTFAEPIRFLHIDATHTYEEVRDNIATALPLMVPGGVICGDDVHHPPVQQAVLEAFPKAFKVATLWWSHT